MRQRTPRRAPNHALPLSISLRAALLSGVKVGLIGGAGVGIVEAVAAIVLTSRHFERGWLPTSLIAAALGKAIVTHIALWAPTLGVIGLVYARVRRLRPDQSAEPALFAVLFAMLGVVVVPVDLELARIYGWAPRLAAGGGVIVAGLALAWLLSRVIRARGPAIVERISGACAVVMLMVLLGFGASYDYSPLLNPARFRAVRLTDQAASSARPNVLFIVLDTVRADRMSCHGYDMDTTPFLKEWSRQAIVFDRAISNGMWTVPSHAAMFTGLPVRSHGVDFANLHLDDSFTTLAEALADRGYATASFSNNPWLAGHTNLMQGFDEAHVMWYARQLGRFSLDHLVQKLGISPPAPWLDMDLGAAITNDLVSRWLDERTADQPFFLFINYMDAHLPYTVPRFYRRLFMSDAQVDRSYELLFEYGQLTDVADFRFNIEGGDFLAPADQEILRRLYEAGIRYLDDRVREMIKLFESGGLLENTLVVIVSDHGEYLGTHGMWAHRFLTYQDVSHVTMLLREPGRTVGRRSSAVVQPSDLYRTVLDVVDGRQGNGGTADLFAMAEEAGQANRYAVTEYNGPSPEMFNRIDNRYTDTLRHRVQPQTAVQDERFKYMESADGTLELYDLVGDPGELNNIIGDAPEEARRLAAYLEQWRETVPVYDSKSTTRPAVMDPAVREALESLGYLVGDEGGDE